MQLKNQLNELLSFKKEIENGMLKMDTNIIKSVQSNLRLREFISKNPNLILKAELLLE